MIGVEHTLIKTGRPDGRPIKHAAPGRNNHRARLIALFIILILAAMILAACGAPADTPSYEDGPWQQVLSHKLADSEPTQSGEPGPGLTWYQVFVYSFYDSDGDLIGDINGVTQRLDYIHSMGFDGIWLSPIHPSSTYHKYNVSDYMGIDPVYGNMDDFDALIAACNDRGIKVILDMVVNHSDINHPWFTQNPEYYNISDKPGNGNWERLPDGRYYECQFWGEMPDLNLDNPEVRAEFEKIFKFWLDRGVHGFRLDAVKDYYSGNIEKNVESLTWLNDAVKRIKPDAYLVGEAWDTTNSIYQYYRSGIDSFFSFPFAGSDGAVARTVLQPDSSIEDFLQKTVEAYEAVKAHNPGATNAPFFTNHDMSRAAGFLRRDMNLIKTAWGLSLMQPGDAFVYYGEELGMSGSGKDENKRAPMFWTDEDAAPGMTSGPPYIESVSHSFPPAVGQVGEPDSIYSYIRDAVCLRGKYPQIGRGSITVIPTGAGNRVGAVLREWQGSEIIVAYNISPEPVTFFLPGTLQDHISATGETPEQQDGMLTLPGYTIAILVL